MCMLYLVNFSIEDKGGTKHVTVVAIAESNSDCYNLITRDERFASYFDETKLSQEELDRNIKDLNHNVIYAEIYEVKNESKKSRILNCDIYAKGCKKYFDVVR